MDTKELEKICNFFSSLPVDAATSAYLINPLTKEEIQQGYFAYDIDGMVLTDQDILNYRAGVEQIPDFALEYAKLHMK
nr:MAG TPA: hypothetical protein [Caudoviricetes sp.]DAY29356.1 MAG TPA: hypothetical protein [Caudoviricetes sp.]